MFSTASLGVVLTACPRSTAAAKASSWYACEGRQSVEELGHNRIEHAQLATVADHSSAHIQQIRRPH